MIITLKGADFSQSNIGTLNSWFISYKTEGSISKKSGLTSVTKGEPVTAEFTLAEGAELEYIKIYAKTDTGYETALASSTTTSITYTPTQNIVIYAKATVVEGDTGGSEGGGEETDPTPDDTEIGTTTTFGSTNVEVTIIGKFSDFNFANKCVISTSSGSSCSLNTAGASGRISSPNQVLKVSGGEAVTFNSSISGLQYALIEFTDKPCTISTLNKSGQYGQAWTTEASMTLHSNTKYLGINFNNGSADMTSEQLESLKTAIVLS